LAYSLPKTICTPTWKRMYLNYLIYSFFFSCSLSNGYIIKIGRGLHFYKPANPMYSIGLVNYKFRKCLQTDVDIWRNSSAASWKGRQYCLVLRNATSFRLALANFIKISFNFYKNELRVCCSHPQLQILAGYKSADATKTPKLIYGRGQRGVLLHPPSAVLCALCWLRRCPARKCLKFITFTPLADAEAAAQLAARPGCCFECLSPLRQPAGGHCSCIKDRSGSSCFTSFCPCP